jgi:hypothetical protein
VSAFGTWLVLMSDEESKLGRPQRQSPENKFNNQPNAAHFDVNVKRRQWPSAHSRRIVVADLSESV